MAVAVRHFVWNVRKKYETIEAMVIFRRNQRRILFEGELLDG